MGCCCELRLTPRHGSTDQYSLYEANMGLNTLPLPLFYAQIKELRKCVLTHFLVGQQFKGYLFGSQLYRKEGSLNKTVLSHQTFKRKDGGLDYFRLCALGLLYCKASFAEKCDFLVQVFDEDEDGDGVIKEKTLKRLVRLLVYISVLILPNLANGLDADLVKGEYHQIAKSLVKEAVEELLGGEPWIHCDEIKRLISRRAPFILDPVQIRAKFYQKKDHGGDGEKDIHKLSSRTLKLIRANTRASISD